MVPIFPDSFSILIFLTQASHPESHLHQMFHPKYSTPGVSPMIPREKIPYFLDYKTNFPSQIWEENGGASYNPNVAYLAVSGAGSLLQETSGRRSGVML